MNFFISYLLSFISYLVIVIIMLISSPLFWGVKRDFNDMQLILLFSGIYGVPMVLIVNLAGEFLFKAGRTRLAAFMLTGGLLGIIMYIINSATSYSANTIDWTTLFTFIIFGIVIITTYYIMRKKKYKSNF